jgi:hypothetical protein
MKTLGKYIGFTRTLAVTCLLAGVLSHLALTDIAHGEPDVKGEWAIVQVSAFLVLLFIMSTLMTLRRFKQLHDGKIDEKNR